MSSETNLAASERPPEGTLAATDPSLPQPFLPASTLLHRVSGLLSTPPHCLLPSPSGSQGDPGWHHSASPPSPTKCRPFAGQEVTGAEVLRVLSALQPRILGPAQGSRRKAAPLWALHPARAAFQVPGSGRPAAALPSLHPPARWRGCVLPALLSPLLLLSSPPPPFLKHDPPSAKECRLPGAQWFRVRVVRGCCSEVVAGSGDSPRPCGAHGLGGATGSAEGGSTTRQGMLINTGLGSGF